MIQGKRILVSGGAGFLGSFLVARLATVNRVTVVDDLSTGRRENLRGIDCKLVKARAWGGAACALVKKGGFDYIVNCAANGYIPVSVARPWFDFENNLVQPVKLLETVRNLKKRPRVAVVSSAAVLGEVRSLPMRETDLCAPVSPYGAGKLGVEQYASVYASVYGVPVKTIRLFPLFGPRQRKQLIYDLLVKLHAPGPDLRVYGTGRERRDLMYVEDAAAGFAALLEKGAFDGSTVNLCTGKGVSVARVAEELMRASGIRKRIVYAGGMRAGDVKAMIGSTTRLKKSGFAAVTPFEEGIRRTVTWFRSVP
ncbi:MAG: hypothetical protein A2268_08360 [Candidatus Raymondbacteria bacterium RifOxyA12_full_50_37]|nr:MAG: hypothetical protein A2268_08360 [Candidatus Raymondbacteria bacterium RifOxyA12_full_50_37]OGJ90346.1 MAG: hypothetical protein A2248_17295 [Candidatus Raymondbacteria bacterium RIFOXYA2_FULL_49_16]OGP43245.1 MAG: hypothetical protein A2324_08125 [Candidatus Raymondbacteria bacterium RIFOXYB2_FULL_49_35]